MTYYYGTILRICHFLLAFGRSSMAICVYYLLLVGIQLLLYIGISIIYTTILSNEYYGIFPCIRISSRLTLPMIIIAAIASLGVVILV